MNQQADGFGVYESHDGAYSLPVELLTARSRETAPTVLTVPVAQQRRSLGVGPEPSRGSPRARATAGPTDVLRPSARLHPDTPERITDITTD